MVAQVYSMLVIWCKEAVFGTIKELNEWATLTFWQMQNLSCQKQNKTKNDILVDFIRLMLEPTKLWS